MNGFYVGCWVWVGDTPSLTFLKAVYLKGKTMMSCSHSPGPHGMAGDVVIHSYTFMARTLRAVSLIIEWIKMPHNHYCIKGSHFLKEHRAFSWPQREETKNGILEWAFVCQSLWFQRQPTNFTLLTKCLHDSVPHCFLLISRIGDRLLYQSQQGIYHDSSP